MKITTKKWLILLCFSLLVQIPVSSQITLDSTQVKETALIFAEHQKLTVENPLLKQQIKSLEELNKLYIESDSIRNKEINLYQDKVSYDEKTIKRLKSIQKRTIIGSSVGGIVLFILGLFL